MRNPIRVLHVFATFGAGGPQVRTCDLMKALGPNFHHMILAVDGHTEARTRIAGDSDYRIVETPPGKGSVRYPYLLYRVLREHWPDLMVTYNWGAVDAVIAGAASRLCPVVHIEDGMNSDEARGLKRRRVWLRRVLLNRIAGVVTPSKTLWEIARREFRVHTERLHWIANGVDTHRFRCGRNMALRRKWGIPDDAVVFGFTGRLAAEKNLPLLLQAFAAANMPDAWLAIIGPGSSQCDLERMAVNLGIRGKTIFTGLVEDVAPYYGALDVFVMSSVTEQMPMSLLEAMSSGLPAIATDVGDTTAIVGETEARVIVPPGNTELYSDAMRVLRDNPGLRVGLGNRNRERCVARYSFDRMVSAYHGVFMRALGRNGYS